MKHLFTICLIFIAISTALAQRPAADEFKTSKGTLIIQPVFHATVVFTWDNKTIYIDPYGGAAAFKGLATPDMVLITNIPFKI